MTTTEQQQLLARAEHHTDWHVYIDPPGEQAVGYCTGHGGEELVDLGGGGEEDFEIYVDEFNPVLHREGWRVTGPWRRPVEEEDATAAYVAPVERAA